MKQKKLNRNVIREYRMSKSRERAKRAAALKTEVSDCELTPDHYINAQNTLQSEQFQTNEQLIDHVNYRQFLGEGPINIID